MALDYSKLTTAELEAIANDDFRKLSNRTLRAIANEPEPKSITDNIKDFGKATASLADTGLNAVTGMLDYAAYPLARAFGRTPEQATQETSSPKDVIGRGLGITQDPAYQSEASRRMMAGVGQGIENYAVKPLSSATGLPEQDVGSMVGSAMIGSAPYVNRAVASTGRGVKNVVGGASDIAGGAIGRGTGYIAEPGKAPVGYQVPSSRAPLRNTVMLPEDVAKFERGEMPYGQMPTEVPIQQLPRNAVERTALKLSGGEIPYQGQAARAFGERLGETYRNPFTAALDIGSLFTTGVPLVTAARTGLAGVQGAADAILARRGLDPNLPTRLADYQSGARPMPGTPPAPPTSGPISPGPGPSSPPGSPPGNYPIVPAGPATQLPPSVMTAPDLSRRVNIEGQSSVLPSQINVSNSQTARPQPLQPVTPQQLALEKTQQIVNQQAVTPAPVVRQPVVTTPASNVQTQPATRSSNIINKELTTLDNQMTNLRDEALSNRLTPNTPEGQAYSNQLNEMAKQASALQKEFELAKKAEKQNSKKKGPTNVNQMIVDDGSSTWNSMKLPDSASPVERRIALMTQAERDRLQSNLQQSLNPNDPMHKEYLDMFNKYRIK
jgi:hypothetical protein